MKIVDKRPFNKELLKSMIETSYTNMDKLKADLNNYGISDKKKVYLANLMLDEAVRVQVYERILKEYF